MKKRPAARLAGGEAEFCKLVRANARRHSMYDVFRDFCEMAALSFSNSVDRLHFDKREARYLQIVGKYMADEVARFPAMLACLIGELEGGMSDCLGRLFMALDLGDAGKGQFFTPYEVSLLMARMVFNGVPPEIERGGFVTLNEPAVGAGGMVIAAADTLRQAGVNYQQCMHVIATDIDPTAVHMAYVQFSLLHIPAVVIHGNALWPSQSWDEWVTPAHVLGRWDQRLASRRAVEAMRNLAAAPAIAPASDGQTASAAPENPPQITAADVLAKRQAQAAQLALF